MTTPEAPHVLVIVKGLGLGGAERLIAEQVGRGRADGVRYTVAYVRPDKDHFVAALREAGAEVVLLGAGRSALWPLRLRRLLLDARPDIVHSHSPLPAGVVRLLVAGGLGGRSPRPRLVYTEHNRWQAYRLPVRALNAATMPLEGQVWSVSTEARSSVRPGRQRERVEVLHHGIDVAGSVREAARQAATLGPLPGDDGPVLLHVANRRPEKNHEHLIASFGRAAASVPDLHLWLVGQHLDDPAIAAAIDASRAADRIAVLGYRQDVLGLMTRTSALVLGSDHEGLPVAVMEALALGVPVVSTAVGGVPEAVTDGVEGLLVPPRDVDALATVMITIASDPERRDAMGDAARMRAASFDSAEAVGVQLRRYEALLSERGRR